jgi:hypothetical protein
MARPLLATLGVFLPESLPFLWLAALELTSFGPGLPRTVSKKVLSAKASLGIAGAGLFFAGVAFYGGAVLV